MHYDITKHRAHNLVFFYFLLYLLKYLNTINITLLLLLYSRRTQLCKICDDSRSQNKQRKNQSALRKSDNNKLQYMRLSKTLFTLLEVDK